MTDFQIFLVILWTASLLVLLRMSNALKNAADALRELVALQRLASDERSLSEIAGSLKGIAEKMKKDSV